MLQHLAPIYMKTLGQILPTDWFAPKYPVSVKGVCRVDGRLVLLKNERGQWDLPGGKLVRGETAEACLIREVREELGISVQPLALLGAKPVKVMKQITVLVLVYECQADAPASALKMSYESFGMGLFEDWEARKLLPGLLDRVPKPEMAGWL